jgi:hypothetical protein
MPNTSAGIHCAGHGAVVGGARLGKPFIVAFTKLFGRAEKRLDIA